MQQTMARYVIWVFATAVLGLGMYNNFYPENYPVYFIFCGVFLFYTVATHISIKLKPDFYQRRFITIIPDVSSIAISMYLTDGGPFSPFFLLYPWLYFGYGLRYGREPLLAVAFTNIISYLIILWFTDTWHSHYLDISVYLLFLGAFPLYVNAMMQQNLDAKDEAEKASKDKGEFLATMSHEIRTPMSGIVGMTSLLNKTALDSTQKDYVNSLQESSTALNTLINDILDLSKIEAGKYILENQPFLLSDAIKSAINIFHSQAKAKGLQLRSHFSDDVPDALIGDAGRLRQILLNLISNAIKFTPSGSVTVDISSYDLPAEDRVLIRIEVTDTGVGISEDDLKNIFDPFFQCLKPDERKQTGTGLGTTISKNLAEIMGGTMGVASQVGIGSTFWVEIPYNVAERSAVTSALATETDNVADDKTKTSFNILLAEDSDINAKVIKTFLEEDNHSVTHVINGREAVTQMEKNDYDLVIMDMRMPELNGLDATRIWREYEANEKPGTSPTPIVALTANATEEDRKNCIEAGMNQFLSKPVSHEKLTATISQLLSSNQD
ncbi:MAG: ATP-binding protein [Gammaproteobacteria bacterium]